MRVTREDLEARVERLTRNLTSATGAPVELALTHGSRTNGIAFRLHDGHGRSVTSGGGYLGMTKAEALATLEAMSNALEYAAWVRQMEETR